MKWISKAQWLIPATLVAWAGCGSGEARQERTGTFRPPAFDTFDNGAFTMQIPTGWVLTLAGDCATTAFVLRDPQEPLRQVLFFGVAGPFYQTEMQKQIDLQYMSGYGYAVEWADMPVVRPLTPDNALAHFSQIASSQIARRFMPACPPLHGFQAVSSVPQPCPLPVPGASSAVVRVLFVENDRVAEGMFSLTTAPFMPMLGGPGGGTAQIYLLAGITAPKGELDAWHRVLAKPLESFSVHPHFVQDCLRRSDATFSAVMNAGRTLRETSDQIVRSWEQRNQADDVMAAKRSDAILGRERLYDPQSGSVYEFDLGFQDRYRLNPGQYRNAHLQELPAHDHALWTAPALNGPRELGLE